MATFCFDMFYKNSKRLYGKINYKMFISPQDLTIRNNPFRVPNKKNNVFFLGEKPVELKPATYADKNDKIPDPIYNFFFNIPKYEIHSHFNGATPLNISKLFLNREGRFIGQTEEELSGKYYAIRKESTSLADWLKKTYELKCSSITPMDIMSASYAIAMSQAKHNGRYLEVRIDPFSSSFVGTAEDNLRAVEAGLKNAREDLKEQGIDFKTGIILLAERHGSPEKSLKTARLATKLKSQRTLFEKMKEEVIASEKNSKVYKDSKTVTINYIELVKLQRALETLQSIDTSILNSGDLNYGKLSAKLNSLKTVLKLNSKEFANNDTISMENIDKLYNDLTVSKNRSISTIDLVPAVYFSAMDQIKQGQTDITLKINPADDLFEGDAEDVLRSVQVGLRNAEIDAEKMGKGKVNTSIIVEVGSDVESQFAARDIASLAVKLKSQRVMFEKMHKEMKQFVNEDKVYTESADLDKYLADLRLFNAFLKKIKEVVNNENLSADKAIERIETIISSIAPKFNNPTSVLEIEKAYEELVLAKESSNSTLSKEDLLNNISICFSNANKYLEDKAIWAEKIFDNLKHYSTLKIADKKEGSKLSDRYLRMGSGVIPNVKGVLLDTSEDPSLLGTFAIANKYLARYNDRKEDKEERIEVHHSNNVSVINMEKLLHDGKSIHGKRLDSNVAAKEENFYSFDDSHVGPYNTAELLEKEVERLLAEIHSNSGNELNSRVKEEIKNFIESINTLLTIEQQKFLLSRRILKELNNYSKLRIQDKRNGTQEAVQYSRMGLNIIPNVVGYDIAGNENDFPVKLHKKALQHIQLYNALRHNYDHEVKVTVHSGEVKESGKGENAVKGWQNILDSIKLGAHRIGHGIELRKAIPPISSEVTDPEEKEGLQELLDIVVDNGIIIETCPKSNYQTRAISGYRNHPILDFLDSGIAGTINTDNAVTSGTDMTNEFVKVFKRFNWNISEQERKEGIKERFTLGHVKALTRNAIRGAFALSQKEKAEEEKWAMERIDKLVKQYSDKIVLKDNEPIMLKVQKQVVAFTGNIKKAIADQLNKNKAA